MGTRVVIRDLTVDGNKAAQSSGSMKGIRIVNVGDASSREGVVIQGTYVKNTTGQGIYLDFSDVGAIVTGNTMRGNASDGLFATYATNYTISGNTIVANGGNGIALSAGSNVTVSGNVLQANTQYGVSLASTTSENTIAGNTLKDNVLGGVGIVSSNRNSITGNVISASGGTTDNNGILLDASDNTTIEGNSINDTSCTLTCYAINISNSTSDATYLADNVYQTSSGTATINDAGTNTNHAGQAKTQGGLDILFKQANSVNAFAIQNASGTSFLLADTNNSQLSLGNSSGTTAVNLTAGSGGINATGATNINTTGTSATTIGNAGGGIVTVTSNGASNWGTSSGLLTITGTGGTTLTTSTTGALTLNTGTTGAINMGTSGGAKTITIGNTTAASKLILTGAANTTTSNTNGIVIGSATTDATQINLELDSFNTLAETASTCTTTVNQGALYYNSSTATVRNCVNGTWQDVMSSSNLAAIIFGVVPDSGTTPGDLVGLGSSGTTGPCKVSVGANTTTVSWTACVAYTGFTNSGNTVRRVAITAGTATTTNTVAGNFQHLCLSQTTGQPALTTSAAENSFTANANFVAAPQLCLADIKFGGANNTITEVYDTRVFTTTTKQFVNVITTSPVLGGMVTLGATDGQFAPTTAATNTISGVVVAQAGNITAGSINTIIATAGPIAVKQTGTTTRGQFVVPTTTAGYGVGTGTAGGAYTNAGVAQMAYTSTCAINSDACRGSAPLILNIR